MADIYNNMLEYLTHSMTRNEIAQTTGMPLSTMSYAINGLRPVPKRYREELQILYSSTVYKNLIDRGVVDYDAKAYAGKTVGEVVQLENEMNTIFEKLTIHTLSTIAYDNDIEIDQQFIDDNYGEYYDAIITNIQNAPKPVEYYREVYL